MYTKLVIINNLKIKGQCSTCFYRDDSGMCSQKGINTYGIIEKNCWGYKDGISLVGDCSYSNEEEYEDTYESECNDCHCIHIISPFNSKSYSIYSDNWAYSDMSWGYR